VTGSFGFVVAEPVAVFPAFSQPSVVDAVDYLAAHWLERLSQEVTPRQ
jgi:hypothetical protein